MQQVHGSTTGLTLFGVLFALVLNGGLGVGIIVATHFKSDAIAAQVQSDVAELFQCRYFEGGRLHQLEVEGTDWQDAEEKVCGVQYRGVNVPPLLARGYSALILRPDDDALLMAQRESCSCSSGELPPIFEDIGIVEAPMLGTLPKQKTLPQIVNNPEPAEKNAVNPDLSVPDTARPKDKKDKKREPDLHKLIDVSSNFDDARPANDRESVGDPDGSKTSTSATGKGDPYLQKIKAKLDNNMNAPSTIPKSTLSGLDAKLWIKVGGNGSVWAWDFTRKSGNTTFDNMIERTIKRFMIGGDLSFPPPPEDWTAKRIPIRVDGSQIR